MAATKQAAKQDGRLLGKFVEQALREKVNAMGFSL
jgi:hypothetical protein